MTMTAAAIKKYANDCANRAIADGDEKEAKRLSESHRMGILSDAEFAAIAALTQAYIKCRRGIISRGECADIQKNTLQKYDAMCREWEAGR